MNDNMKLFNWRNLNYDDQKQYRRVNSQILKLIETDHMRRYNICEGKEKRKHSLFMLIAVIFLICFVLILFQDKPEVLSPILAGLGGLISGFIGGHGFGGIEK
jgi:hypothetical protein